MASHERKLLDMADGDPHRYIAMELIQSLATQIVHHNHNLYRVINRQIEGLYQEEYDELVAIHRDLDMIQQRVSRIHAKIRFSK